MNVPDQLTIIGATGETPEDALRRRLAETADKELWNGATLIGPHRDDIAFELDGRELGTFASRGQQRTAILALKLARATVSNDSGLVHVSAALGTPTIGIFGPTSPWHWAPLNPLAATIEALTDVPCRPCHKPTCALGHHRCMNDIPASQVMSAVAKALAKAR